MSRRITKEKIQMFKTYLENEEKSVATVEKYVRDLENLCNWLKGEDLEKNNIIEYKNYLIEKYKTTSVNSMLSSINSFFVFCQWYDLKVKTIKCQRQIFAMQEKVLTKEEYLRLLQVAKTNKNKKLYYIMQTICSCGIRVSELRFVTVEAIKKQRAEVRSKGKNRQVLLSRDLCRLLKEYVLKEKIKNGSIFVTKSGMPINRRNIWSEMKKLCEKAKVCKEKVFPHNLRHLFARAFYSQQKDIVRLADLLGHSSINTTRIYTIESGAEHLKQIQRLGLIYMRA